MQESGVEPGSNPSVYEGVGGGPAVATAVTILYRRLVVDPHLGRWFAGRDIGRLVSHQRALLARSFDGPDLYAGRDLRLAHAGLGITDEAFDAFVDRLLESLSDLGMAADVALDVRQPLSRLRSEVVQGD